VKGLRLDEPVIVLTCGRSGSTLLRFLLDAHPALACPPETSILELCTRMGVLRMLLAGPPDGDRPALRDRAAESVRQWVTGSYAAYLERAGKVRWCDKSLGSAESADKFLELFPQAKFICLYRHVMDVVDSLLDACPFGLSGYGLDPFVTVHPGNNVAAAADYWVCHTRAIMQFEERHPDSCLRMRYEDLAADPQEQADRIFSFLGEEPIPSVAEAAFSRAPAPFGPSDHKIWDTDSVHAGSVGRGARIPIGAIPMPVLALANSLLEPMGYEPVGENWNFVAVPVLADCEEMTENGHDAADLDELEAALLPRIRARLAEPGCDRFPVGAPDSSLTLTAALPLAGTAVLTRSWRVDLATSSVTREVPSAEPGSEAWVVTGHARDWQAVLSGQLTPATALRHGWLRIAKPDSADLVLPSLRHDLRGPLLTWLLKPPRRQVVMATAPGPGEQASGPALLASATLAAIGPRAQTEQLTGPAAGLCERKSATPTR
jgi:hypothetical protein